MTTDIQHGHQFATRFYQLTQRENYPKLTRQYPVITMENLGGNLTKLQLLQEDYRSKLLHEKEKKLNELFEQRMRALPKQGSVREFFVNRRMVATSKTTKTRQNHPILPPIKTNSRYEDARLSKNEDIADKGLPNEVTKLDTGKRRGNNTEFDYTRSELAKLRQRRRKPVQPDDTCDQTIRPKSKEKQINPNGQHNNHRTTDGIGGPPSRRHSRRPSQEADVYKKGRKVTSKAEGSTEVSKRSPETEVHKRGRKLRSKAEGSQEDPKHPSHEAEVYKRGRKTNSKLENGTECSKPSPPETEVHKRGRLGSKAETSQEYPKRLSQEIDIYKRGRKLSSKVETSPRSKRGDQPSSEENELSRSLVKIKELSRKKTEELLQRSMTIKQNERKASEELTEKRSQKLEEMRRLEIELRETIARERKKLQSLQQRKQQAMENTTEKGTHGKQNPRGKIAPTKQSTNKSRELAGDVPPRKESLSKQPTRLESKSEIKAHTSGHHCGLSTCSNCGRSFMKERITRHENACRKASARKKKPFDSRKKRAEGTELDKYIKNEGGGTYETSSEVAVTALL